MSNKLRILSTLSYKFLVAIILFSLTFVIKVNIVFANGGAVPTCPTGAVCIPNPIEADNVQELADNIADWLLAISIPIAVTAVLYSAVLFMTAAGNEEKAKKAKQTLMWVVAGVALLLIAKGITATIKSFLT